MKSNKVILIVVAVVLLGLVIYFATRSKAPGDLYGGESQSLPPPLEGSDNSAAINQELQSVDLGDLESEFQSIDSELNNL